MASGLLNQHRVSFAEPTHLLAALLHLKLEDFSWPSASWNCESELSFSCRIPTILVSTDRDTSLAEPKTGGPHHTSLQNRTSHKKATKRPQKGHAERKLWGKSMPEIPRATLTARQSTWCLCRIPPPATSFPSAGGLAASRFAHPSRKR